MKSILSMALLTVFFVSCKKSASEGNQNGKKNNANSGVAPANILKDDDFRFTAGEDLKIDVNDIPLQLLDLGFRARPFVPDWENARPPTAEEEASKIFICLEKISKGKEKYRVSMNGSELSFFEDRDDTECEKIEDDSYTKTKIHLEKYVSRFFCEGTDFSKGIHATRIDENLFSCRTKSHYLSQSQTNSEVLVSHSFDPKERLEVAKALSSISSISGDPCSFSIEGDTWTLTSDCSVKNLNKSSALNTLVKIVHSKGSKFLRKSDTEFFSSGSSTFEINDIKGTMQYSGPKTAPTYTLTFEGKVLNGTIPTDFAKIIRERDEALGQGLGDDSESFHLQNKKTKPLNTYKTRPHFIHRFQAKLK